MSRVRIEVSVDGSEYEVSKHIPSYQSMARNEPLQPTLDLIDAAVRDIKAAITERDQEEA